MVRYVLLILGILLTLLGIIGFFNDPIFGIFAVDNVHNVVHLGSGLLAIILSNNVSAAKVYGKVMAAVYGIVMLWGFLVPNTQVLGLMEVNGADNILHLILTLAFLYVGFASNATATKVKV